MISVCSKTTELIRIGGRALAGGGVTIVVAGFDSGRESFGLATRCAVTPPLVGNSRNVGFQHAVSHLQEVASVLRKNRVNELLLGISAPHFVGVAFFTLLATEIADVHPDLTIRYFEVCAGSDHSHPLPPCSLCSAQFIMNDLVLFLGKGAAQMQPFELAVDLGEVPLIVDLRIPGIESDQWEGAAPVSASAAQVGPEQAKDRRHEGETQTARPQ